MITKLTNKELYKKCLNLSEMIKKHRNQFIALLPEVEARKLYLEYGMHSIYEFAAKLGCLSNQTVDRVLRVSAKLEDKPVLKAMFESGEVGWSKLEVAVKLKTPENEVAKILPTISKEALVTFARDLSTENFAGEMDGLFGKELFKPTDFASEILPEIKKEDKEVFLVKMNTDLLAQLRVLKRKLEKETKQPLSWEDTLGIMVSKLQEPELTNPPLKLPSKPKITKIKKVASRYIPKAIKRQVLQKTNQLCAHPKCNKPAEHLHHQVPYSISKNHESIIPLCKAHHDIEHHKDNSYINRKYQQYKVMQMRL